MVTSRGCPFHCNWCAKPIFGQRYAQRTPASAAAELRRLKDEIAPDHVWFADDIFGVTREWIRAFGRAVAERDARIPFMIQSRVDLMSPDVVDALAVAGAQDVWMGVESGSQRILDAMDKGCTIEESRAATRTLKSRGIRACWFIQLGYPSESWEDLLKTRDALREERPDDIGVSVAYPLPNTKFYDRVQAQLGARRNWDDTGDLAMLFEGTFPTSFYRRVRDVLHEENRRGVFDDARWAALADEAAEHEDWRASQAPA
jgi:anaerobic magnesium-protoporphyrin IX monomethyl ester cyclase